MKMASSSGSRPEWWSQDPAGLKTALQELVRLRFPAKEAIQIDAALNASESLHRNQQRGGGGEYLAHPLRVALSVLLELSSNDAEMVQAALLHDVLEDRGPEAERRIAEFSGSVRRLVRALTRSVKKSEGGDSLSDEYLQRVIASGDVAISLKLADKIDNLRDAVNHPRPEKRRSWVREGYQTYLPLTQSLSRSKSAERTAQLLTEALCLHETYCDATPRRHFTGRLEEAFDSHAPGTPSPIRELAHQIYDLDRVLDGFLLLNPALEYWLTRDRALLVKTRPGARRLVDNVATVIIERINHGDIRSLVELVDLPGFLLHPSADPLWQTLSKQLDILRQLLWLSEAPAWLSVAQAGTEWLLRVVHGRLLSVANPHFPPWYTDFGAQLAERRSGTYRHVLDEEAAEKELELQRALIGERLALWRLKTGSGSLARAARVLGRIDQRTSRRSLLAARLTSELVEAAALGKRPLNEMLRQFDELWQDLEAPSDALENLHNAREERLFGSPSGLELRNLEIVNYEAVRSLAERGDCLRGLASLLKCLATRFSSAELRNELSWIDLNRLEIEKRWDFMGRALDALSDSCDSEEVSQQGIVIRDHGADSPMFVTVEPGPWLALKNRLPEITDEQLERRHGSGFSATEIFDTLLLEPSTETNALLWMPRIFRVLDSILDLCPNEVQRLTISFDFYEPVKNLVVPLPLPHPNSASSTPLRMAEDQKARKDFIANFIAATIYNFAITLGVRSASLDTGLVDDQSADLAFAPDELEATVRQAAATYGYDSYGRFVENYHFQMFEVRAGRSRAEVPEFTTDNMKEGRFLGIDIGGTDVKVCLVHGDPLKDMLALAEFKTPKQVALDAFVDRILEKIGARFADRVAWDELDGIGISWPGAVRDSKIVGHSGTLGKIALSGNGGEINYLTPDARSREIQSVALVETFRRRVRAAGRGVKGAPPIALENDGNAEAYGNYSVLELQGARTSGGTIIAKLGTSLAGGHIDPRGAVSPHVAEFSKAVLKLRPVESPRKGVTGVAREYVSSQAVRRLADTFEFEGELLFLDVPVERIESVELGELLSFWHAVDEQPLEENRFLEELVASNNRSGGTRYQRLLTDLTERFERESGRDRLKAYVGRRAGCAWHVGLGRLAHLMDRPEDHFLDCAEGELPADLDTGLLAHKVLGTVALFSQLGLQIAHLIVLLYNIYRKDRMAQVILAGGVLSGDTGPLVKRQAEAYLSKYYDKVYGPAKNLGPDAVRLARAPNPKAVGPLGAAMVASRRGRLEGVRALEKRILRLIETTEVGRAIPTSHLLARKKGIRADTRDARVVLERLVGKAVLLPVEDDDAYVKIS